MPAISKIGRKLALFGVVSGLFLIGWAARHSVAHGQSQDSPPLPNQATPSVKLAEANPAVPQGLKDTKSELGSTLPEPGPALTVAVPELSKQAPADFDATSYAGAPAPVTVATGHTAAEVDDPEKVANVFVQQNQMHAESQLNSLKEEAEKLRARLAKVEAGIKRWDRLLEALKQSQGAAASLPPADRALPSPKGDVPTAEPALKEPASPAGDVAPGAATFVPSPPLLPEATKPAGTPADLVPRSQ